MPDDSAGIICGDDISRLTDLFLQFEGASDPLSVVSKEAEQQFDALIERLYNDKVSVRFQSLTLLRFRSYARNICRQRLAKQGPPFPCV
jgi:hypothetical protein